MYFLRAATGNFSEVHRKADDIKFIVVHYTGNNGDTARNNLRYYSSNIVKASAHFFVDEKEVCCSVPFDSVAWHCGTTWEYRHKTCRNANSIGVEMCSRRYENGTYYFKSETVELAAQFIAQQMRIYKIPIENVVRHYDVTGKLCPKPFVNSATWDGFKRKVVSYYNGEVQEKEKEGLQVTYYEKLEEIPAGEQREVVRKLMDRGTIKGNGAGLHLSSDMVRMMVFNNREGLYK